MSAMPAAMPAPSTSTYAQQLPTHPEENKDPDHVSHTPHTPLPHPHPPPPPHTTRPPQPTSPIPHPLSPPSPSPSFQHLSLPLRVSNGAAGTYSAQNSVNGRAPGGLSQISPLEDEDEQADTFDTMKDLSPSPRSYSQSHSSSPYLNASHSFYTALPSVPDILSSVDRSLLPILAPFNFLDSSTLSARLAALNITRGGMVEKKQSQMVLGAYRYNKRYLLLKDNHLRYDSSKKENPLKGGMDLRHVRVERSEFDLVTLVMEVSEWWKHNGKYEKTRMAERRMEWKCDSEEEREAWVQCIEESKMMHEVYPLNKESTTPFPIALILGVQGSGKSTVFKHVMAWRPASYQPSNPNSPEVSMANKQHSYSSLSPRVGEQVKHAVHTHRHHLNDVPVELEGWMPVEVRLSWKKRIFMHLLKGLCVLGDAVDEHAVSSEFVYAKEVLEDEREKLRVNEDENCSMDKHTLDYIHRVWGEPLVKAEYERRKADNEWVKNLRLFLDKVDVMPSSDWVPTFTDVFHCYYQLPVMTWKQVDAHTPHRFRVYDIGGSAPMDRVERWKLERFLAASLVIFTVDLTCYDKPSSVDPNLTLLQESLLLYQQLLANAMYQQWGPIHVYFTSIDTLREKLQQTPFKEHVQAYEGGNDKATVVRTIMGMFAKVGGARYVGRVVCAVDRGEMKRAVNEDIERRREAIRKGKERQAQA